jgi:small ligand-binding sensory domain FIST
MRTKKQSRALTKAARGAREQRRKFLALKKEAIKACQSLKKAVSTAEEKLRAKALEIGLIVNRFNLFAKDGAFYSNGGADPHFEEDIDFEDLKDTIQTIIDEIKEVEK